MDCSLTSSSVHGILQTRILEWVAIYFSKGASQPRIEPESLTSPALAGGFFTASATWEAPGQGTKILMPRSQNKQKIKQNANCQSETITKRETLIKNSLSKRWGWGWRMSSKPSSPRLCGGDWCVRFTDGRRGLGRNCGLSKALSTRI